ncbi:MAG TPA: nucleotide sugar dehydrogenase [bacterium]|nr:nucleotide sugar dehydrogenase [bacterium]
MPPTAPIGFLGLSHLGLVTSIAWASRGDDVIGVDRDNSIIAALTRSQIPVHEPGLAELLRSARPRMTFNTDVATLAACPLVVLSQDVPTTEDNRGDVSAIRKLVEEAIPHLEPLTTLVLMSQLPPGFTRSLVERIGRNHPDKHLAVFYWVETLVFGQAVDRVLHPERIMLGCEAPDCLLPDVLKRELELFGCPVQRMRYESAELTKAAINLYLACGVTFANTLSDLCERVGADWSEVIPALRLDARIGPAAYIHPGLGISGGNLERDLVMLRTLAEEYGTDTSLIEAIVACNARRLRWVLDKLESLVFAYVPVPTIAVWGLAYKKGTHSLKNSPALSVISSLRSRATIRAYDPVVQSPVLAEGTTVASSRDEALAHADCLLIMTGWDEFETVDAATLMRAMRNPVVIDCVGALEKRREEFKGIRYVSMGRGMID